MRSQYLILVLSYCLACCNSIVPDEVEQARASITSPVDYNFHVKPILSDRCFSCHGPDEEAREADLRLDIEESAKQKRDGSFVIRSGSLSKSQLVSRILSDDESYRMPPPESKLELTTKEKAILLEWIDQGAEYKEHWSFIAPVESAPPEVGALQDFVNNEIDYFILAKLKTQGLQPAPRADKERLLKRVYMDLTGLPPSIKEIDEFLVDQSPNAFEKVVDHLLASEACAERLTMEWMDIARYADSHGLHADGWRRMWPWRDWVINAFHQNLPYDQFVTQQLAGDLVPNASRDQILATAFHRNHPMTAEGGAIDEEFRLEYVADRTNTTATAMMGITMECARCHDHKFDPISQEEYYQMTAFFNNVHELGMTGDDGNYGPLLQLASPETERVLRQLDKDIEAVELKITEQEQRIRALGKYLGAQAVRSDDGLIAYLPLDGISKKKIEGKVSTIIDHRSYCTSNGSPKVVLGKVGNAIDFVNEYDELYLHDLANFDLQESFSAALWVKTRKRKPNKTQVLIGNAGDKNNFWRGWDFYLDDKNRLNLRLIHSLPHNYLHLQSVDSVPLHTWTHVAFSYDGSTTLANTKLFLNGSTVSAQAKFNNLYKNIRTVNSGAHEEIQRPARIGKSYRSFTGDNGIFQGLLDEIKLYNKPISEWEVSMLAHREKTVTSDAVKFSHACLNDQEIKDQRRLRSDLIKKRVAIADTIPEIMVMEEMEQPRPTYVLDRGQYDAKSTPVKPGTPDRILPFSNDLPSNRLGLAKWLFDPNHPLTARATVNRYWQMVFGQGIVKTARDFGSQGALPSHPELLDWLALYLIDQGWNLRSLLKKMIMSATYQQSSVADEKQLTIDPENVLLARGPSYRWPAEMIRDNALASSGLLVRKVGGPSVKPYQPEGLWIEKGTFSHKLLRYEVGEGEDLYRRSLYTFIKRTSPHPVMTVFDAPNRDVCTVTRESTNTPLQALVLLNDPQFVEASKALAERVLLAKDALEEQIKLAFRLVTGRRAQDREIQVLKRTYDRQMEKFSQDPEARQSLLSVGEYVVNAGLDATSLAAMTVVTSTLLNHDEAYMKR